ncbi:MAG: hypothetical protein K8T20_14645 [Planctomycetes bacterium]|nr:hypothetical protein [Planctomycetota bacterium]
MTTPGEVGAGTPGRTLQFSSALRMVESIIKTPMGRRLLRIEVVGAWSGEERGLGGQVYQYMKTWDLQADFVVVNLRGATSVGETVLEFSGPLRDSLGRFGGDCIFTEASPAVGAALDERGLRHLRSEEQAISQFDGLTTRESAVGRTSVEGWTGKHVLATSELRESIVLSPQGRRVFVVVPEGAATGGDWSAGRAAREHVEGLAQIANFVVFNTTTCPSWSDAASAAAFVLRGILKSHGGDCVLVGQHAALLRSVKPYQWKAAKDEAEAMGWLDRGE